MAQFPIDFLQRTEALLGHEELLRLSEALERDSPISIRFNPFKTQRPSLTDPVPWCRYGYYLEERPSFTLDPAFHAGAYYVQEASSMFIEHLCREAFPEEEPLRILDLCAAPGGKSTLLSTLAGPEGLVVANEVIRSRALVLVDNVRKWGMGNVVVTNNDPSHFAPFEHYFDLMLVDAPCSGEGMFRKNTEARDAWSAGNINLCQARGRRILNDAWGALRPGGILIYSTCTFNAEENEETVRWMSETFDCEGVTVDVPEPWGVVCGEVEGIETFRFFPHRLRGEGLFATILRKSDGRKRMKTPKGRKSVFVDLDRKQSRLVSNWVLCGDQMHFSKVGENIHAYYRLQWPAVRILSESLTVLYSGVLMGQLFGTKLRPEHPLALFHDLNREVVPAVDLSLEEACDYLRKVDLPADLFHEGVNLVCYENLPLGWIKRIGQRSNNMYPKELRIATL